ncbi:hypothetical protein ACQ4PT_037324 [Festuca glaucescens]
MSSRGGGGGGRRGGHGRGGESSGEQEGGRGRGAGGGGGGRGRGLGGEVGAERGGHGHATRGRAGELGGRGGVGRGRGRGGDAARGGRGGGAARGGRGGGGGRVQPSASQPLAVGRGGVVQPSASQPVAVGLGGVGTVREHDPQYGGAGLPRPGGQVAAPTAAADVLAAEVERKMVLTKADERPSSSSATAAVEEKRNLQESQAEVAAPGSLPPVSIKVEKFPARPGFGTVGKRCRVRANHFLVQVADKNIYHYDVRVAIYPETRSRDQNRSIINELVRLHRQYLDGRLPVYDGRKSIYTAGALPFQNKEFVIKLVNANRGNQREEEYRVTIKHASNLDLYNLQQFLAGRHRELPQDIIQALDIALRECPTTKYVSISRSFFSQSFGHGGPIGNGVECWRGYYQSLRPTQMGLSLNIDISATSFYKAQPVMAFAVEYLNPRDTSRLSDQDRLKLKKALRGVRVVATHRTDKTIRYKITGITSAPLKDLTFDQDGTRVSVVEYFKKQYSYLLRYTNLPCLQAGSDSRPIYLPMEIVNRNNYGNDSFSKEFGMKVTNQLALVDARVLPAPRLKYHDSGRDKVCDPLVGQWNMNNKVGGRNMVLENALYKRIPQLTDVPTIVFGADVTHPSPGEDASPSIAAVVASMDWPEVTKYKCMVSSQGPREEIIADLYTETKHPQKGLVAGGMIRELLVSFYKATGRKPSRIIFYRDGVSEGQFSQVLLYEMDAVRKACATLQEGYLPPVTFVVVQKRHHTRLFPENHGARDLADRSGNILPGTVVDTKICHPTEFDFYLCSHAGIQLCSVHPLGVHRIILQLAKYLLILSLLLLTVPPAYYAHLAAFRARHYLEDEFSDQGSSSAMSWAHERSAPVRQLPKIKDNVKEFMFYC